MQVVGGRLDEAVSAIRSALITRILASDQFSRTVRLRDFLRYVAARSIEHPASPIPEQEIGVAVFHRVAGYDTAADNIVRVSAGDLRRRLDHYFLDEGRAEDLICEMPRGGYALTFHHRVVQILEQSPPEDITPGVPASIVVTPAPAIEPAPPVETVPLLTPTPWKAWLLDTRTLVLSGVVLAAMVLGSRLWLMANREPWQRTPPLRAFWSDFLKPGGEVEVVMADSSLALAKSITNVHVALPDYLGYTYRDLITDTRINGYTRGALAAIFSRNIGSVGDFKAAQNLYALINRPEHLVLGSPHDFSPDAIKTKNVILIGSSVSNPWVDLYRDRRSFSLEKDAPGNVAYIRNPDPRPGELKEYPIDTNDAEGGGFAVVAILPNFDPQRHVLIIEGNDSQSTLAASNFITSVAGAKAVMDRIGSLSLPNHVEILLRSSKLMATPLKVQIVAVHYSEN